MAYKKIPVSEIPKQSRAKLSRFERTSEWKMMRADLEKGLNSKEALQLVVTDEEKAKYGIQNRRTIARFLQKYLADHKLPYVLKSFRREQGDFFFIQNARR
jgi:hypothetical protein